MSSVEPIRDASKIGAIKRMLRGSNLRDYALFTFGINTGLRVGDVLALTVGDVLDDEGNVADKVAVTEQKTSRSAKIKLNKSAHDALSEYLSTRSLTDYTLPLFPGKYEDKALHRVSVHRLINKWCRDVGLTRDNYGAHTPRKTWGYQARKSGVPIELIQGKLGHRSPSVTRKYIGISQDEIHDVEDKVCL